MLNKGAMDRAINVAIERSNVVEVVDKAKGQPIPAYNCYHVREGSKVAFFSGAFIRPTWVEAWL